MKHKFRKPRENPEWKKIFNEMLDDVKKHNERIENNDDRRISGNDKWNTC